MSTVSEAVEDCPADRCAGRTGRREAFCGVHQRHASSSGNTAGAAEDQRRTTYIFTSVRERRGSALASQRTGLTSVETGDRWSSGGRCCQRFSRFRRAATRYYAAEPARTDLHRSTHRDVAREDQRRNAYILPLARPSKGKAWSAMITWTQPATGAACAGLLRSAPQYGQYLSLGLTPRWHCGHAGLNW